VQPDKDSIFILDAGKLNTKGTIDSMDDRTRFYIEREYGFSLESFPSTGITLRESPARRDEPGNRMVITRMGQGVLATGIPRVIRAIALVIRAMGMWELFSPVGVADLRRALRPEESETLGEGFHYTVGNEKRLRPVKFAHTTVRLLEPDAPPDEDDLVAAPQRLPPGQDFVPAFAVYQDDKQVASSGIRWKSPGFVEIGVSTHEDYRGRGYGLAVVASAIYWILAQGAVAYYPVAPSNVPSVRIARRLGFSLTWQEIYA